MTAIERLADWLGPDTAWMRGIVVVLVVLLAASVVLRLVGRLVKWMARRLNAPPLVLQPVTMLGRGLVVLVAIATLAGYFFAVDFFSVLGATLTGRYVSELDEVNANGVVTNTMDAKFYTDLQLRWTSPSFADNSGSPA